MVKVVDTLDVVSVDPEMPHNIKVITECSTYLLLTEFEVRTVSHGPSFFPSHLWPKREVRGP